MSPEAIRRILKSRWRPSVQEQADRIKRWKKRSQEKAATAISIHFFREKSTALRRYRVRKLYQTRKDNIVMRNSAKANDEFYAEP
jgi:hypothetical protein